MKSNTSTGCDIHKCMSMLLAEKAFWSGFGIMSYVYDHTPYSVTCAFLASNWVVFAWDLATAMINSMIKAGKMNCFDIDMKMGNIKSLLVIYIHK